MTNKATTKLMFFVFQPFQVLSGEITLKVSVIAVEELLRLLQGNTLLQLRLRWPATWL